MSQVKKYLSGFNSKNRNAFMVEINLIVSFKSNQIELDTDLDCVHNSINKITIEIDTNKYTDFKLSMKNKNRYPYPFNSKEFISTVIAPNLIEIIDKIEIEMITK